MALLLKMTFGAGVNIFSDFVHTSLIFPLVKAVNKFFYTVVSCCTSPDRSQTINNLKTWIYANPILGFIIYIYYVTCCT